MSWIILWLLLSVPATLLIGAFMGASNRRKTKSESTDQVVHEQTIVGNRFHRATPDATAGCLRRRFDEPFDTHF